MRWECWEHFPLHRGLAQHMHDARVIMHAGIAY